MTTRTHRILSSLIALMAVMEMNGQVAPEMPRLVVSVVIDQLRSDYLQAFMPLYGQDGFARLMREGRTYTHAEYPFANPDRASAMACLMSGTVPYENGIVAQRWLNRETLQPVFCVDDKQYPGHGTNESSSPQHLMVSTLADELKVSTEGRALAYSLSPNRDAAILGAGHAADGGFWLNDETGQWCTTSYYGAAPEWLSYYNNTHNLQESIAKIIWQPSNELVGQYNYFVTGGATDSKKKPFKHRFKGDRGIREFKASAMVNEEVTRFTDHLLQNSLLGMDAVTDLLSITYYAGNFDHQPTSLSPLELQDTYVRLDEQIARLIQNIEQKVGSDRVLFMLTGTGYTDPENADDHLATYRIPTGEFNITRAQMLLNMYLSAIYGQAQYVEASMGNHIYLNLKMIENKGLNQSELLERSQTFLLQLSGVCDVFTSHRLLLGAGQAGTDRLRNAYNTRCSGDIIVQVAPGWQLVNEHTNDRKLQRDSFLPFPLFFLGCNVEHAIITELVTIDRVAPTLSAHMRIRAPNACSTIPLTIGK